MNFKTTGLNKAYHTLNLLLARFVLKKLGTVLYRDFGEILNNIYYNNKK